MKRALPLHRMQRIVSLAKPDLSAKCEGLDCKPILCIVAITTY